MTTNIEKLSEALSNLSILEASELIKELEAKWGVKASVGAGFPMPMNSMTGGVPADVVEKTEFDVELVSI